MNKDLRLLEEAYQSIYESTREPEYFGPSHVKQDFLNWLYKQDFEVHEDGSVSVQGNVDISVKSLKRIPFNFKEVGGYFYCSKNNLASLEGAPRIVKGNLYCYANKLTSLKGAPKEVGGDFCCSYNNLTSLEGAPEKIGGDFDCSDNELTSLQGAPVFIRGEFRSDQFSDEDYREFVRDRKIKQKVDKELDKDLNVDLGDFS